MHLRPRHFPFVVLLIGLLVTHPRSSLAQGRHQPATTLQATASDRYDLWGVRHEAERRKMDRSKVRRLAHIWKRAQQLAAMSPSDRARKMPAWRRFTNGERVLYERAVRDFWKRIYKDKPAVPSGAERVDRAFTTVVGIQSKAWLRHFDEAVLGKPGIPEPAPEVGKALMAAHREIQAMIKARGYRYSDVTRPRNVPK